MSEQKNDLDRLSINTIRFLSADAIQKANSGHPGICLGAGPMAYCLWSRFLRHDPADPEWPDRDRFILSAGHGSMLLYSLLHLFGYDLPLEEIRNFRQWGSITPGHPENFLTPGVEATTGPLGQGLANAVGMAIAEAHLADRFNRPGFKIIDHYTYSLAGDGCMMEGLTAEASSLAGHLKLGKLIVLYDDNLISLAGSTGLAFSEDLESRYRAYGWQVLRVADGDDLEAIASAIGQAREETGRPSLIMVRTVIGCGAPDKEGSFKCHGSPLGPEAIAGAKKAAGWPAEPAFFIPPGVLEHCRKGEMRAARWREIFDAYRKKFPQESAELERAISGELPPGWAEGLPEFFPGSPPTATRVVSGEVMQVLGEKIPELIGGSADLNPSTKTTLDGMGDFQSPRTPGEGLEGKVGGEWGYGGRNIHFGVREHAMGAIAVGMALHRGVIPYTATFLVFSDYERPAIRMAALSRQRVIFIFTHDSVGVGEDGPTHQPVEQLMALRAIPNLTVIRPADANETVEAWKAALRKREGPTALVLTRQEIPVIDRNRYAPAAGLEQGGYILKEAEGDKPEAILIATGSEVSVALAAAEELDAAGTPTRVVSMPSWEIFDRQDAGYREEVLPRRVKARVSVEAGVTPGWERYVGLEGQTVGIDRFGVSAPGEVIFEQWGFTPGKVAERVRALIGNH
jgi:transketolase